MAVLLRTLQRLLADSVRAGAADFVFDVPILQEDGTSGRVSVRGWILNQLSTVRDHEGGRESLLSTGTEQTVPALRRDIPSQYRMLMPDGSTREIVVDGVILRAFEKLIAKNEIGPVATYEAER